MAWAPAAGSSRRDELIARTDSQLGVLEDLRVRAARLTLGQGAAGA